MSTGLAVVRMDGASVAHSSYTVAHAGRRKVVIAGGGEMTHHTRMLDARTDAVNDPSGPRVAFQGAPGAFSELAIAQHWDGRALAVPSDTFADAIAKVTTHATDFAAIPVENAIAGPVHAALSALADASYLVDHDGEVRIDIRLCLMAPFGATLTDLRTIYSHPMALAQSCLFLAQHPWLSAIPHADTAGAAHDVAQRGDRTIGAIAGAPAADRYGLHILARSIEDIPANWTRFVIVRRR